MDDLRSEVRDAFAKEQSKHPPAIGLRQEIVRSTAVRPARSRNLQWVAVVAALLIAALVVAGLMSSKLLLRGSVPAASPASSPSGDYGPPPNGINLIWMHDPNHPSWLVGYDWSGAPRGTIKPQSPDLVMAPDGQSFTTGVSAKGGHWQFYDRLGNLVSSDEAGAVYNVRFADDNRHVCAMTQDQATFAYKLWTLVPGGKLTEVGEVARDSDLAQTVVVLAACSIQNDRAIAYRISISAVTEAWIVRLSDGQVLAHHQYSPSIPILIASRDARYVAEGSGDGPIVIRRVADWTAAATVDAGVNPLEFSGDDTRLLVSSLYDTSGGVTNARDVDWASGKTLWTLPEEAGVGVLLVPEPGGPGFVVGVAVPGSADRRLYDLQIVAGSGSAVELGRFDIAF
jgi:hypothetical protein